jgi:hypothetical protein
VSSRISASPTLCRTAPLVQLCRRRAASRALRLPSSRPMVFIQYFSDSDALAYEDFTLYDDRGGVREDRHVSQSNRCLEPYVLPRLTFQLARQAFEGRMNVQECVDECLADPNCHGFVTWELECFYRGGAHAAANASTHSLCTANVPSLLHRPGGKHSHATRQHPAEAWLHAVRDLRCVYARRPQQSDVSA